MVSFNCFVLRNALETKFAKELPRVSMMTVRKLTQFLSHFIIS